MLLFDIKDSSNGSLGVLRCINDVLTEESIHKSAATNLLMQSGRRLPFDA